MIQVLLKFKGIIVRNFSGMKRMLGREREELQIRDDHSGV